MARVLSFQRQAKAILGPDGKPMSRAYEASSSGRRLGTFNAPSLSPNKAVLSELDILRRRSRALVRNNPWINRAIAADVANEIGTGIVPRSQAPDDKFREASRLLWKDWSPDADADQVTNAYGIQWLAARARRESGECFIRIRQRRLSDGLPVPVQFQVLESDFCPSTYDRTLRNGNEVVAGIEFDAIGRRVAYWMYRQHPSDGGNLADLVRVPAEQVIHHYIPLRPGQIRGEPVTTQALIKAYVFDQYDDAELERKKSRAQFTGVIKKNYESDEDWQFDPMSGEPIDTDNADVPMFDLQPGTFPSLLPGEDVTLFDGDDTGSGYFDFARMQLMGMAAGYGIPFELMTGDYRDINDRVWRAIVNQYRREIEQIQDLFTIQQICRRMWIAFVDGGVLSGALDAPSYETKRHEYLRAEHRPQAWPYLHPLQDAQAMKLLKNEAFDSRQGLMAERGKDAEEVDRQRAEDLEREQRLSLNQESQS